MRFIPPWDHSRGGRAVVQSVILHVKNSVLEDSTPKDVGSIVIRDASFGVTGR